MRKIMDKIIWIGHRESDVFKTNNFFDYSITSWGSNQNGNIAYCKKFNTRSIDRKTKNDFIIQELNKLLEKENYKVIFYSSTLAYSLLSMYPDFEKNFICLNAKSILDLLNNKINTKLWISNHVPVINFMLLSGSDCQIENLQNFFPGCTTFVIQESISSGGLGTFLMDVHNSMDVYLSLEKDSSYLISPYAHPSFSVNSHIFITENDIVAFPPSTQIIEKYENKLVYSGADFII